MNSQPNFDVREIEDLLGEWREGEDTSLMTLLEEVQARYRYLPKDALILISERVGVPLSQAYSVATFYNAFSLKPKGRHIISVCLGTACIVRGSRKILERISDRLGIGPGATTEDGEFTLETVNCLGACALGPIIVLDGVYSGQMNASKTSALLRKITSQGEEL